MNAGQLASGLFFAVVGLALAFVFLYEAWAIWTGHATISDMTADLINMRPQIAVVVAFVLGGSICLIVAHFADVLSFWRP
jgi:hypothetical protein